MRIVLLLVSTISSWKGLCIWSLCCLLCVCLWVARCQVTDVAARLEVSRQHLVRCVLGNQVRQVEELEFQQTGELRFGLVILKGGEDSLALQVFFGCA